MCAWSVRNQPKIDRRSRRRPPDNSSIRAATGHVFSESTRRDGTRAVQRNSSEGSVRRAAEGDLIRFRKSGPRTERLDTVVAPRVSGANFSRTGRDRNSCAGRSATEELLGPRQRRQTPAGGRKRNFLAFKTAARLPWHARRTQDPHS